MSKVSEFHKVYHGEHDKMATVHATMMGHHEEGSRDHAFHKAKFESHTRLRDYHKDAMAKALTDELNKGDRVEPTNISAVTPNRPAVTMVPRPGERIPEAPPVDQRFADLVKVEEIE